MFQLSLTFHTLTKHSSTPLAPTHLPSCWHVFPFNQHCMGPIGVHRGCSSDCLVCQSSVVHRAVRIVYLPHMPIWIKPLAPTHLPSCWHVFPSNQHRMGPIGVHRGCSSDCLVCQSSVLQRAKSIISCCTVINGGTLLVTIGQTTLRILTKFVRTY